MKPEDLEVGKRYKHAHLDGEFEVVDATPDRLGVVPTKRHQGGQWRWCYLAPAELSPIVERYTVELRPPKAGERYLYANGEIFIAAEDYQQYAPRWVIVDGEVGQ